MRQHIGGNSPWEREAGYARAVRVDRRVVVAGTTATGADGKLSGGADPYAQAIGALDNIAAALAAGGARLEDLVRTRLYITRREDAAGVMRAHRERLGHVRPAATLIIVSGLIDPAMLVEIEAEAVASAPPGASAQ